VKALVLDSSRELWEMKIDILSSMVLLCEQPVKRFARMSLGGETKMERQKRFSDGGRPRVAVSDALWGHTKPLQDTLTPHWLGFLHHH
jgi:hypothetical protein